MNKWPKRKVLDCGVKLKMRERRSCEIFFHVGIHKTASTSIQHALRTSSLDAESEGWVLLRPKIDFLRQIMHANEYSQQLSDSLSSRLDLVLARYPNANRIILSYEGLSGEPTAGYLNSYVTAQILKTASAGLDAKVILYLRRQDDWLESLYTQTIQQGESHNFEGFLENFFVPGALNYNRMLCDFEHEFGVNNLIVRSYHSPPQDGIIADFGRIIDSSKLEKFTSIAMNPSYSKLAVDIAKFANPNLSISQKRILRSALQGVMSKARCESFSFFKGSERESFMKRFYESNQLVADRYFNGDMQELFPPVMAAGSDGNQVVVCAAEDVAKLACRLILESCVPVGAKKPILSRLVCYLRKVRVSRLVRSRAVGGGKGDLNS